MIRALILGLALMLSGQMAISPARGGVASAVSIPPLRCSASIGTAAGSPSSIAIPICGAAQAGDLTLLFCNSAWNISTTATWTTIVNNGGVTWNFYAAQKLLSSGDISTGTVTCSAAGGDDMAGATVTFIGATSGIREFQDSGFSVTCPTTLTTSGAVLASDIGIYWTSGRTNGSGDIAAITPGSGVLTNLQSITTTNLGSSSLLGTQFMAGGAQTNSYTYTGGLCANFDAIQVIVTP